MLPNNSEVSYCGVWSRRGLRYFRYEARPLGNTLKEFISFALGSDLNENLDRPVIHVSNGSAQL